MAPEGRILPDEGNAMAFRPCLLSATAFLMLTACGQADQTNHVAQPVLTEDGDECVPIAEGFYEFRDGKFLASAAPSGAQGANPAIWKQEIENGLAAAGLSGLTVTIRDRVAVVSGTAGTAADRDYAFKAGKAAIEGHQAAGAEGLFIVDGVTLEGEAPKAAATLALLATKPLTEANCQAAFNGISQSETILFQSGNALISPVSHGVLDVLAGTAMLCEAFSIEIGSHTDSRGAEDYNMRVSQGRAEAVREYLTGKGVSADALKAVGYGESRLLDTAQTAEAHALNRRTEFIVSRRGR